MKISVGIEVKPETLNEIHAIENALEITLGELGYTRISGSYGNEVVFEFARTTNE